MTGEPAGRVALVTDGREPGRAPARRWRPARPSASRLAHRIPCCPGRPISSARSPAPHGPDGCRDRSVGPPRRSGEERVGRTGGDGAAGSLPDGDGDIDRCRTPPAPQPRGQVERRSPRPARRPSPLRSCSPRRIPPSATENRGKSRDERAWSGTATSRSGRTVPPWRGSRVLHGGTPRRAHQVPAGRVSVPSLYLPPQQTSGHGGRQARERAGF
jgi:hypothetical protein